MIFPIFLKGGKFPISLEMKNLIDLHLESQSEIAANRMVKIDSFGEKIDQNVRYRKLPYFEIYDLFEHKDQIEFLWLYFWQPKCP